MCSDLCVNCESQMGVQLSKQVLTNVIKCHIEMFELQMHPQKECSMTDQSN